MLAILPSLGFQEMFVLLVIGLLLYGRNLPEAGRTLGKVTSQLRRGFNEFKDQMNRDADLSEMKRTLQSTKDEIKRTTKLRQTIKNPGAAVTSELRGLTNEALSSSLPAENGPPEAESGDGSTNGEAGRNGASDVNGHADNGSEPADGQNDSASPGSSPPGSQPRR